MRKLRFVLLAAAQAVLLTLVFSGLALAQNRPPSASHNVPSSDEQALLDATNRERTAHGVPSLHWDDSLASAAQAHAALMAKQSGISHQFPGEPSLRERTSRAGARFSVVAENVALGPDTDTIHFDWMHSPGHRANILDAQLTAIGIAVVARGKQLYAVQDFSRSVENLSFVDQEKKIAALLAARGLQILSDNNEARHACVTNYTPSYRGRLLVLRFTISDIDKLPAELEKSIHQAPYAKATVGACEASGDGGFTQYRFAVLLY
jgi:uncharacterized protein YkwD